jgi:hypothetical protein
MLHHFGYVGFGAWVVWTGADLAPGGSNPHPSRFYHVVKRLCASVRPGVHVRKLTTDDPDLLADHWEHMDMLAWEGLGTEVVMLVNPTANARSMDIRGLKGKRITVYRTAGTDENMKQIESVTIVNRRHTVLLPGYSIVVCVANDSRPEIHSPIRKRHEFLTLPGQRRYDGRPYEIEMPSSSGNGPLRWQ